MASNVQLVSGKDERHNRSTVQSELSELEANLIPHVDAVYQGNLNAFAIEKLQRSPWHFLVPRIPRRNACIEERDPVDRIAAIVPWP